MKNKYFSLVMLVFIIFIAFAVRVYRLSDIPTGFFADEASTGYNAYKILTTGKDEYGEFMPFFFRSFGDYKHPIAFYTTVPLIAIFGLNEFATRLQSVLFGVITIISLYFLGKELFSKKVGLWASFIGATIPWLVHYNRVGFDYSAYAALYTFSLFIFTKCQKNYRYTILGFAAFSVSLYSYQPAKLIVPLTLIGLCIIYGKTLLKHKKQASMGILLFLFIAIPLIVGFMNKTAFTRFNQVSIFSSNLSPHEVVAKAFSNYLSQISPVFFLEGENTFITRHFTEGLKPFLLITTPFVLIGFLICIKNIQQQRFKVLLLWLILYPFSAALVADGPFTGRTIIGAPMFAIFIALGISTLTNFKRNTKLQIGIALSIFSLIALNLIYYSEFYFYKYPLKSADFWGWQYGPREIMKYFLTVKDKYDELYISGEFNAGHIFLSFYDSKNTCESKCKMGDFWREKNTYNPLKKQLFSLSPEYLNNSDLKTKFVIKKTVYYPNKAVAFYIGEVVQ